MMNMMVENRYMGEATHIWVTADGEALIDPQKDHHLGHVFYDGIS